MLYVIPQMNLTHSARQDVPSGSTTIQENRRAIQSGSIFICVQIYTDLYHQNQVSLQIYQKFRARIFHLLISLFTLVWFESFIKVFIFFYSKYIKNQEKSKIEVIFAANLKTMTTDFYDSGGNFLSLIISKSSLMILLFVYQMKS